jgi:hypothetical protein
LQKLIYLSLNGDHTHDKIKHIFSRYTKGDQLGKLRNRLFKGLDNMRFYKNDHWFRTDLLNKMDTYDCDQFSPYPFTTDQSLDPNQQPTTYTSQVSIDNLNRLLYFAGISTTSFRPDGYRINYYK